MSESSPVTTEANYVTVVVNKMADESVWTGLIESVKNDPKAMIFDCAGIEMLKTDTVRNIVTLATELKKAGKSVRLFSTTASVVRQLQSSGLAKLLPMASSMKVALTELGVATSKGFDVNLINPFLNATMEVLKVQVSLPVTAKEIYLRSDMEGLGDISGVIGLVAQGFNGTVILTFPKDTFLAIMSRMLGETFTEITKDIQDGASELTNIIFGQAKVVLNQRGYEIKMALPSIVVGDNHTVYSGTIGPRVVVPFESEVGSFFIEICLS